MAESTTNYYAIKEFHLTPAMKADEIQKELNRTDEQLSRQAISSDPQKSARARKLIDVLDQARRDLSDDVKVESYVQNVRKSADAALADLVDKTVSAFKACCSGESQQTSYELQRVSGDLVQAAERIRIEAGSVLESRQAREADCLEKVAPAILVSPIKEQDLLVALDPLVEINRDAIIGSGRPESGAMLELLVLLCEAAIGVYARSGAAIEGQTAAGKSELGARCRRAVQAFTRCAQGMWRACGYVRLGEEAYSAKQYDKAKGYASHALTDAPASSASYRKAEALVKRIDARLKEEAERRAEAERQEAARRLEAERKAREAEEERRRQEAARRAAAESKAATVVDLDAERRARIKKLVGIAIIVVALGYLICNVFPIIINNLWIIIVAGFVALYIYSKKHA